MTFRPTVVYEQMTSRLNCHRGQMWRQILVVNKKFFTGSCVAIKSKITQVESDVLVREETGCLGSLLPTI